MRRPSRGRTNRRRFLPIPKSNTKEEEADSATMVGRGARRHRRCQPAAAGADFSRPTHTLQHLHSQTPTTRM